MKKASNLRLSLRKLLVATLAVGPLAVLPPTPLQAALPINADLTVPAGSGFAGVISGAGVATITATDRTVIYWGVGKFNIDATETYSFSLVTTSTSGVQASGASVLNKVGYDPATGGPRLTQDAALVEGSLQSNGKVFVLVNGGIFVDGGATISTSGGVVFSTLGGELDSNYRSTGTLSLSGDRTGDVNLGSVGYAGTIETLGGITATLSAGAITVTNGTIESYAGRNYLSGGTLTSSSVRLENRTPGAALNLSDGFATVVSGNLTVITDSGPVNLAKSGSLTVSNSLTVATGVSGAISQDANAIIVGVAPTTGTNVGTGTASLSSGAAPITLTQSTNNFQTVTVTNSGSNNVSLYDTNTIKLGDSRVGGSLVVRVADGVATYSDAITNTGTLTVSGNAEFTVAATSQRANINLTNLAVSGAVTAGYGSTGDNLTTAVANTRGSTITLSSANPLTLGALKNLGGGSNAVSGTGTVTLTNVIQTESSAAGVGGGLTITGNSIVATAATATISATSDRQVSLVATNGNITTGAATITVAPAFTTGLGGGLSLTTTTGSITTGSGTISATGNVASTMTANSGGNVTLGGPVITTNAANLLGGSLTISGNVIDTSAGSIQTTGNGTTSITGTRNVVLGVISTNPSTPGIGGTLAVSGAGITANGLISVTSSGTSTLISTSTSSDVTINAGLDVKPTVNLGGGLTVSSGRDILVQTAGTVSVTSAAVPVTLSASRDISIARNLTITSSADNLGGSLVATAGRDISTAGVVTAGGNLTNSLTATGNVSIGGPLTSTASGGFGGALTITGNTITASSLIISAGNATSSIAATGPLTITGGVTSGPASAGVGGSLNLSGTSVTISGGAISATGNGTSSITASAGNVFASAGITTVATADLGGGLSVVGRNVTLGAVTATSTTPVTITSSSGDTILNGAMTVTRPSTTVPGGSARINSAGSITTGAAAVSLTGNVTNSLVAVGDVTIGSGGLTSANHSSTLGGALSITGRNITTTGAVSITGNTTSSLTASGPISIGAAFTSGNTSATAGGRLTLNGSSISTTGILTITSSATSSITTSGDVTFGGAVSTANSSNTVGGAITVNASNIYTSAAVTLRGNTTSTFTAANDVSIGSTLTTAGTAVGTGGAMNITAGRDFRNTGSITFGSAGVGAADTSSITASGDFLANAAITADAKTSTSSNAGNLAITATGNATVNAAITARGNALPVGGNLTVSAARIDINTSGGLVTAGAGNQTLSATANVGNINIGGTNGYITTGGNLRLAAPAGLINQDASAGVITVPATGTASLTALSGISLPRANQFASGSAVSLTTSGANASATLRNEHHLALGTSSIAGNLTLTTSNDNLTLGAGVSTLTSSDIFVGGASVFDLGNGELADNDFSAIQLSGGLTVTASAITLDAAFGGATSTVVPAFRTSFGRLSGNVTGAVKVYETTSINLGDLTANEIYANSIAGGVIDSGVVTANAVGIDVNGSSSVSLAGNAIGALAIRGGANHTVTSNSAALTFGDLTLFAGATTVTASSTGGLELSTSGAASNITLGKLVAGSLTVSSSGSVGLAGGGTTQIISGPAVFAAGTSVTLPNTLTGSTNLTITSGGATSLGTSPTGNLTINAGGAISQTAALTVPGVTSLTTTGANNIVLAAPGNDFTSVVVSSGGSSQVVDKNSLSISGSSATSFEASAGDGAFATGSWTLSLGDIRAGTVFTGTASNGSASLNNGGSGSISQQSGTTLSVFGTSSFTANGGGVVVNNVGNSFGRVNATATNSNIAIREVNTIRVGAIETTTGSATLISQVGSIIEDNNPAQTTSITAGTLTLQSDVGNVQLGTGITAVGNVGTLNVTAPTGSVAFRGSGVSNNLTLGNITSNTLAVTHTGSGTLSQSAPLAIYGSSSFTSNAGNITLTNSSNNFGRLSLVIGTSGKSLALTEANTVNLGTVSVPASNTGSVTITSVNADIIDTGLANVVLGGTNGSLGSGVTTLNATRGNIVLDDPTTLYYGSATSGGIVVNAVNVTLSPLSPITIGASTATSSVTGNLNVIAANGSVTNAGALSVTGQALFQASGANTITATNSGNNFGTVKFDAGGTVNISEASSMAIATGSRAGGLATLTSSATAGAITITNVGGLVNFDGGALLTSGTGGILLPRLVRSVGTLTVSSTGTKDLSALSQAIDLGGTAPVNNGTGSYVSPSP